MSLPFSARSRCHFGQMKRSFCKARIVKATQNMVERVFFEEFAKLPWTEEKHQNNCKIAFKEALKMLSQAETAALKAVTNNPNAPGPAVAPAPRAVPLPPAAPLEPEERGREKRTRESDPPTERNKRAKTQAPPPTDEQNQQQPMPAWAQAEAELASRKRKALEAFFRSCRIAPRPASMAVIMDLSRFYVKRYVTRNDDWNGYSTFLGVLNGVNCGGDVRRLAEYLWKRKDAWTTKDTFPFSVEMLHEALDNLSVECGFKDK